MRGYCVCSDILPRKAAYFYISNIYIRCIINLNTLIILNINVGFSNRAYGSLHSPCQYCLHPVAAVVTVLCLFEVKPMCSEHFKGFELSVQV